MALPIFYYYFGKVVSANQAFYPDSLGLAVSANDPALTAGLGLSAIDAGLALVEPTLTPAMAFTVDATGLAATTTEPTLAAALSLAVDATGLAASVVDPSLAGAIAFAVDTTGIAASLDAVVFAPGQTVELSANDIAGSLVEPAAVLALYVTPDATGLAADVEPYIWPAFLAPSTAIYIIGLADGDAHFGTTLDLAEAAAAGLSVVEYSLHCGLGLEAVSLPLSLEDIGWFYNMNWPVGGLAIRARSGLPAITPAMVFLPASVAAAASVGSLVVSMASTFAPEALAAMPSLVEPGMTLANPVASPVFVLSASMLSPNLSAGAGWIFTTRTVASSITAPAATGSLDSGGVAPSGAALSVGVGGFVHSLTIAPASLGLAANAIKAALLNYPPQVSAIALAVSSAAAVAAPRFIGRNDPAPMSGEIAASLLPPGFSVAAPNVIAADPLGVAADPVAPAMAFGLSLASLGVGVTASAPTTAKVVTIALGGLGVGVAASLGRIWGVPFESFGLFERLASFEPGMTAAASHSPGIVAAAVSEAGLVRSASHVAGLVRSGSYHAGLKAKASV